MTDTDTLLSSWSRPARLGREATRVREATFGRKITIVAAPSHPPPEVAAVIRQGDLLRCDSWPTASLWQPADRLLIQVDPDHDARTRFCAWLQTQTDVTVPGISVAPFCGHPAGLHPLWCIAAARSILPPSVRIEARHDLLGIRLAQIALGFGADTLSGPLNPDRKLPLAGVTRPDETTPAGLAALIRAAGGQPIYEPLSEVS
jgi:hypothetical protein